MFPLRKIVLFKHGVGYFERQKKVRDDASLDLFFKTSEMNDVLKSLTAVDLGAGSISSISYQAKTPIEKQLAQLSLHLDNPQASLTELLKQAIGAEVVVNLQDGETVDGIVIGLENTQIVEKPEGSSQEIVVTKPHLNMLMEGKTLRSFSVLAIESFVFKDPTLKQDLQHLLDVLINAKKKDLKKLTIFTKGSGERTVVASYVIESPVWKTSYRLLLSPEKSFIQGWCLIDNTQDEDWNGVTVTLVGGRPNAFTHDLYNPRFRQRPVLQVKEEAPPKPPVLEEVLPYHSESLLKDASAILSSLSSAGPEIGQVSSSNTERYVEPPRPSFSSIAVPPPKVMKKDTVRKVKQVDFFKYDIDKPVSVKRGQSALVPFLSAEFLGKSCSLYNEGVNAKNPLTVVLFKNTFGVSLDGGPITCFDEETCIGEAMIDTIRPGDEKFVPFGVEMNVSVSLKTSSSLRNVHKSSIENGYLTLTRYRVHEKEYKFDHKGSKDIKDLFIEHRFFKGAYELVETDAPESKTENFYRFHIAVKSGAITLFTVRERTLETSSTEIKSSSVDTVDSWQRLGYIDQATRDKIVKEVIPLYQKITQQNSENSTENYKLSTSRSAQSSARSEVYRLNNQAQALTQNQKEQLQNSLETMMNEEGNIKKYKKSIRERTAQLKKDDAALQKLLSDLRHTANLFDPPKAVQVQISA
jgi:hypothetical protein